MANKIIGNVVGIPNPKSDWKQTDSNKADYIKNKPFENGVSNGSLHTLNSQAGSRGYKVLLREEISSSGSTSQTYDFPYMQNNGDGTAMCFMSSVKDVEEIGKATTCTLVVDGEIYSNINITSTEPYGSCSVSLSNVSPNIPSGGGSIIISGGSSKTYTFGYLQNDGASFAMCYIGNLDDFEVGTKCTITVDGYTATGVIIQAINYGAVALELAAVPWDMPSGGGTLTIGEEAPPKIVYTLDSVDGIEVGMAYSLVNPSGESKYNAGIIKEIAEDKVTVDDDGSVNAKGCFMAIIGHPELGTEDIGINSFAIGNGTIASSKDQSARGRFNVEDIANQYADIVGNGKSNTDRSNAYTLDWDGNGTFKGTVECKNVIIASSSGKRFRLVVDDNGVLSTMDANIIIETEKITASSTKTQDFDFSKYDKVTITNNSSTIYVFVWNNGSGNDNFMTYINPNESIELTGSKLNSTFYINVDPDTPDAEVTITKERTV